MNVGWLRPGSRPAGPALRRAARLVSVVGLLAGVLLIATGAPASAATASSIDDTGWWSRANQDATLGAALVFPDVSAGQLLVEGTPEGATAIAALRATLPEGTAQPVLTLHAASATGGDTAVLLACQAGSGWTGAHAGAWSAKPSPDCDTSAQGELGDGDTWTFDLAALQFGDQINVVLVPGLDPNGGGDAGSTFRIVFDRPTESSIEVSESSVEPDFEVPTFDASAGATGGSGIAGSSADGSSAGGSSGPSFSTPSFSTPSYGSSFGGGSSFSPSASASSASGIGRSAAALPSDEQGQTATAPILSAANPLPPPPLPAASDRTDGRLLGVMVALCAGALLFWSSQQPAPAHRSLSRFAMTATGGSAAGAGEAPVELAAIPEEKRMGGLGRFRRARDTPARRLGG